MVECPGCGKPVKSLAEHWNQPCMVENVKSITFDADGMFEKKELADIAQIVCTVLAQGKSAQHFFDSNDPSFYLGFLSGAMIALDSSYFPAFISNKDESVKRLVSTTVKIARSVDATAVEIVK